MYNLCRVFKTGILAVLTVKSCLRDSYIKGDDSCCAKILIIYCFMLYINYVTLVMRLWDLYNLVVILVKFDMDSLLLFPPHFRRSLGLWSTSQLDLSKIISFILSTLSIYALSFNVTLICSYMWDLTSKIHIWCISDFIFKIGYYNCVEKWINRENIQFNITSAYISYEILAQTRAQVDGLVHTNYFKGSPCPYWLQGYLIRQHIKCKPSKLWKLTNS